MVLSRAHLGLLAFVTVIASCSEAPSSVSNEDPLLAAESDVNDTSFNEDDSVEEVDPCDFLTVHDGSVWCSCQPDCCQSQEWFCSPSFGEPTLQKKEVVINLCDEHNELCDPYKTSNCPPPQIIFTGECYDAYECPPGAQNLDYGWKTCELPNGTLGKQNMTCSKGQLHMTDCQGCDVEVCNGIDDDCDGATDEEIGIQACENECGPGEGVCVSGQIVCFGKSPAEEVCNGIDDDCDGEVDEDQLNVCGECGSVPFEVCDGVDNDCNGIIDDGLLSPCSTACGDGYSICVDGNWVSCNAPPVFDEVCDGLDNNCNGQIDEGLDCICTIQDVGTLFPCQEDPLECGQGFKTCACEDPNCASIVTTQCYAPCYWMTDPPGADVECDITGGTPILEKCNNFDDNCNFLIDEDLFSSCYTGPLETVGVGICIPGEFVCNMGTWGNEDEQTGMFTPNYCKGEVTPQKEICDGVDNDCDGITDYGGELKETDILFIVDWSGSMDNEINAVLTALNQFSATYSDEKILQWAAVLGPRDQFNLPWGADMLELFHNMSGFSNFLSSMSSLGPSLGGGNEMLLDAIYLSVQNISAFLPVEVASLDWAPFNIGESLPPHDEFIINWRPESEKIIIVFTDEKPQSYLINEAGQNLEMSHIMQASQSTPNLKIYAFSTKEFWEWDELADSTGGSYYNLTNNPTEMYNSLMEILDEVCTEP